MNKHTEGPWRTDVDEEGVGYVEPCGVYFDGCTEKPASEHQANANLIAAAPEMYEALRLLYAHANGYMNVAGNVVEDVEKALAKAEGKQCQTS